jgi:Ser/Thr protein kinase RdoA (MazF antagonist)
MLFAYGTDRRKVQWVPGVQVTILFGKAMPKNKPTKKSTSYGGGNDDDNGDRADDERSGDDERDDNGVVRSDFDRLTPQIILEAIESAGYRTTGEYSQLNSYENRVFDIKLEVSRDAPDPTERVIAKFYRPNRWSAETIHDEHEFLADLQQEGIPAIAPLPLRSGRTTINFEGYELALFPKVLGRMPDEFLPGQLKQVGRTLARIHNVGARKPALHRPTLNAKTYGWDVLSRLEPYVYPELWARYEDTCIVILEHLEDALDETEYIRIHGDCHKGNLLHSGKEFYFVDFDDFVNGPVVQDFWMLLSGSLQDDESANFEQDEICSGYEELRDIPDEWHLFEPLRGLRIIHYASWIAQRWNDPFFKRIFPAFTTYNYWTDELNRLERIAADL